MLVTVLQANIPVTFSRLDVTMDENTTKTIFFTVSDQTPR
jgi:hypothetical protein